MNEAQNDICQLTLEILKMNYLGKLPIYDKMNFTFNQRCRIKVVWNLLKYQNWDIFIFWNGTVLESLNKEKWEQKGIIQNYKIVEKTKSKWIGISN